MIGRAIDRAVSRVLASLALLALVWVAAMVITWLAFAELMAGGS